MSVELPGAYRRCVHSAFLACHSFAFGFSGVLSSGTLGAIHATSSSSLSVLLRETRGL